MNLNEIARTRLQLQFTGRTDAIAIDKGGYGVRFQGEEYDQTFLDRREVAQFIDKVLTIRGAHGIEVWCDAGQYRYEIIDSCGDVMQSGPLYARDIYSAIAETLEDNAMPLTMDCFRIEGKTAFWFASEEL